MNIPEVEAATRVALMWSPRLQIGNEYISGSGMETDADFFEVFPQYEIVEGSIKDFVGRTDILVSASLARRIAPDGESVVGRLLEVNESQRTIKGVFADFDGAFFVSFDVFAHISDSWAASQPKSFGSIGNYSTWYRVREDASLTEVDLSSLNIDAVEDWTQMFKDCASLAKVDLSFFAMEAVTDLSGTFDGCGKIGEGTHERFIVDNERFMSKALDKGRPASAPD